MLWLWWLKSCRCSLCNVANPPSIKRVITFNAKYTYSSTKKSQNRARVNETFQLNYCSIMKPVVRVIKIFNNCITDMNTTFLQNFEPSENTWKLSQNTVDKWRNSEEKCQFFMTSSGHALIWIRVCSVLLVKREFFRVYCWLVHDESTCSI